MPKPRFRISRSLLVLACVLAPLGLGCASEKPTPSTASDASPPSSSPQGAVDSEEHAATVAVAEDIRKACGLTNTEARFSYNSAKLRSSDASPLEKLAACFTSGPLRGRKMNLIGRADPRGESEYNLALGGRRADSVEKSLRSHGMDESQLSTTSRGAFDATGKDEAGWAWDRRVDVSLGD